MARKRGGLAGIWDRNKKVIKPIATVGAGLLGGPMAAAALNAAMSGLDREGKGGIGFDVGKGAMGAATGYAMGTGAGALKSGIMSRLGGQAAGQMAGAMPAMTANLPGVGSMAIPASAGVSAAAPGAGSMLGSAAGMLRDPKTMMALGQTAVGGMNAYQQAQQNNLQRQQLERQNANEDEDRQRRAGMDPARAQLLRMLFARLGVAPQGVA
jgi:hypothetical protein